MIEPIFQSFFIDILLSKILLPRPRNPKFYCHILGPKNFSATSSPLQKWLAAQFLIIFNIFLLRHLLNHKFYGVFYETCFKISKLLPNSQKDIFVTHPVLKLISCLLFSTIKHWEISKSDLTLLYLKECMLVNGKVTLLKK